MVSRRTAEFVVGLVAAAVVAGLLSLYVNSAYALAVGLAVGAPALVRTSSRLDRAAYDDARTPNEQVVDGALATGTALVFGLAAAYVAIGAGYDGPIASALAAAVGVLGGQAAFYWRNAEFVGGSSTDR